MELNIGKAFTDLAATSGIANFLKDPLALIMVAVACLLLYLAIVKQFEPLLLLPIAFGMLLTNLLGSDMFHEELFAGGHANWSLIGGAVLINAQNLAQDVANFTVNASGAVLNAAGNVVAQITGATGISGNELQPENAQSPTVVREVFDKLLLLSDTSSLNAY